MPKSVRYAQYYVDDDYVLPTGENRITTVDVSVPNYQATVGKAVSAKTDVIKKLKEELFLSQGWKNAYINEVNTHIKNTSKTKLIFGKMVLIRK